MVSIDVIITEEKRRENGRNENPMLEHWLRGSWLGRAMNLVDRLRTSADVRGLSGRRAVVIAWWAACGGTTYIFKWHIHVI